MAETPLRVRLRVLRAFAVVLKQRVDFSPGGVAPPDAMCGEGKSVCCCIGIGCAGCGHCVWQRDKEAAAPAVRCYGRGRHVPQGLPENKATPVFSLPLPLCVKASTAAERSRLHW